MEGPVIALIGASGYVGKILTKEFLVSVKSKKLKEVRVLTTKISETIQNFEKEGAKVRIVDFTKLETLVESFKGVDVVVSALGTGPGSKESKQAILEALSSAKVKVYFPSEFGTNHYTRCKNYKHELFEDKKKHFKEAQGKGIKTIRIICQIIMESSFGEWFGLNPKTEVWTLIGNGDVPVACSAEKDIGKFTVQAALMAYKNPKETPDLIEFYSDIKTMKEYANIFDKIAGRPTKLEFKPLDQALAYYETTGHKFEYFLQIMFAEGAFDCRDANGNKLLNPEETVWKLKKIEEYAQETKGRPWKDFK